MYLCYIDESGVPESSGNTSHFVLAGISIPVWHWSDCESEIKTLKKKYYIDSSTEIHVSWLLRPYLEQRRILDFATLDYRQRRAKVDEFRRAELLRVQRRGPSAFKQARKNYRETGAYVHLTYDERRAFVKSLAQCVSSWGFARLFAECIDKVYFDPSRSGGKSINEQAFEQLVSRFEQYLQAISQADTHRGLMIHDNNQTESKKHTDLMKSYFQKGTLWTNVTHIIETPLFVDSELTSMIQIADICSYSLRRYLENNEEELFDLVFKRADRRNDVVVGVRHFTNITCRCKICQAHRGAQTTPLQLQLPKP